MAEFKVPGQEEFDAITRRTVQTMKHQLLAVDARYDRRNERVDDYFEQRRRRGFSTVRAPRAGACHSGRSAHDTGRGRRVWAACRQPGRGHFDPEPAGGATRLDDHEASCRAGERLQGQWRVGYQATEDRGGLSRASSFDKKLLGDRLKNLFPTPGVPTRTASRSLSMDEEPPRKAV
jgi:hypothetical protein